MAKIPLCFKVVKYEANIQKGEEKTQLKSTYLENI